MKNQVLESTVKPFIYPDNSILRYVIYSKDLISNSLQLHKILPFNSQFQVGIGPFSYLEFIGLGADLADILTQLEPRQFKLKDMTVSILNKDSLSDSLELFLQV